MEIAKALILAGTAGDDRPWAAAPAGPKHLFPVANRPILFHHLEALSAAGVLEAVVLADPAGAEEIAVAVGDGRDWRLDVRHAVWDPSLGVAGALAVQQEFVGGEPVLVQHGDALLEPMHAHISAFAREGLDALALTLPAASAPVPPPGYLLSARAVSILQDHGDAADSPIADVEAGGGRVRVQRVEGCLPCHGDLEALLNGNRRMLEGLNGEVEPGSLEGTTVQGPVVVHPTATVRRSLLRGPLIVGPGARIADAYVGPYTSIGAGVEIEASEIEYSIVLAEACLRFVGTRIESSVIGRRARVVRRFELPGALRVALGEGAEVLLA